MLVETDLRIADYGPCTAMAAHRHDEATMNIVVRGGFLERISRSERTYARGHVAFCPAGTTHSQTFGPGGARQIICRPKDCWLDYLADDKAALDSAPFTGSVALRHLGDRLLDEIRMADSHAPIACEGILLEIVAAFGRDRAGDRQKAKPPAWLRTARDFLHEHALAPLRMAEVARAAGRHEIHLAREFRRFFGTSIGAYLRRLRTEHAAGLLRQPHSNVSAVALNSGFGSHSHLCREFKARFGVTPSQYRAHHLS
jgi:AraC family transcriptional regulator